MIIDAPATEGRELPWAAFKHGADVYFFWHSVHWRHNSQKQGDRDQNVWANRSRSTIVASPASP
jgi:hypothetical protein